MLLLRGANVRAALHAAAATYDATAAATILFGPTDSVEDRAMQQQVLALAIEEGLTDLLSLLGSKR
jgi:hypothetical protein